MDGTRALILLFFVSFIGKATGNTCERNCGKVLNTCSCHPTCVSLKRCCSDLKEYCVDVSPYSGSILGGTDIMIENARFDKSSQVVCRFNNHTDTMGYVDEATRGHCISPLLYETGWISLQVSSDNGTTFNRDGTWLSVHTGKLDSKFKAVLVNSTKWQYYGTPNVGGRLEMTWSTTLVKADKVNIELWGYRETGQPYSDLWEGKWEYLYSLAKDQPNTGSFSFLPTPAPSFQEWELGSVRVSPSGNMDGVWNVQAAWTEDHALAWHLEEKFRNNSAEWAMEKCLTWDNLERQLPNFLDEIIDCPCTLAQARADTGRFHTDYGCDMEKGSVCTYHPGSVHCVRAIQASPSYGAGQQCCYDSTGAQVLTGDSIGGSTPDRGHDWGSPPYKRPPRIPGESHWVYDVLSFYYCCLWSDNCRYYFTHRPSSDCRRYQSPSSGLTVAHSCAIESLPKSFLSAVVFGDPHFITFDGVSYSFNGKGEYTLVSAALRQLFIQARTEPVSGSINATKLSSVAMREASSDVIEVRLTGSLVGLEVLRNQKSLSFAEQQWMDMDGVFVFSPTSSNVTVMFPSGAGVELRLREGTMTTTILLPEEFKGATQGLLGNMNGVAEDDLVLSNGEYVTNQSNPEALFNFGKGWAVSNESALFTYDTDYLLDTYYHSPRHDPFFIPAFFAPESPDDPLAGQAAEICSGEGSQFCKYDILVGRSPQLGNATRVSFQSHSSLVRDLAPVAACGWLSPPTNGKKLGTTYVQGAKVTFSCNDGYTLGGAAERVCLMSGQWSGEETSCTEPNNIPGIIAGTVIGAAALILLITALILHSKRNKKRSGQSDISAF
ncbi:LOW QUALITY PROTEIN: sushi domain-containing protein 2-like [Neosynchiropus ocellatus]